MTIIHLRKAVCLILASTVLLTAALAGGKKEAATTDPLHIIVRSLGRSTADNMILPELEKATGLKLNFEHRSPTDYAQQGAVIISSGNFPDVMEFWGVQRPNELEQMSEDGIIVAVDELVDRYSTHIRPNRPDEVWYRSLRDGLAYSIPARIIESRSNAGFVIRQDWLDQLGLSVPSNLNELHATLSAFAQSELAGPGRSVIPMGLGGIIPSPLVLISSEYGFKYNDWNVVDGRLVNFVEMPGFREALRYYRRLHQERLIDQEWVLMNREQFLDKMYQGLYGVHGWYLDQIDEISGTWYREFVRRNPNARWSFIDIYPDENGHQYGAGSVMSQDIVLFSTSNRHRDSIRLIDYLLSPEGSDLAEFGIKGVHWDEVDGQVVVRDLSEADREKMGHWMYNWFAKRTYHVRAIPDSTRNVHEMYAASAVLPPIIAAPPAQLRFGAGLNDMVRTAIATLTVEPNIAFDREFDRFLDQWRRSGGQQITTEMNDIYRRRQEAARN